MTITNAKLVKDQLTGLIVSIQITFDNGQKICSNLDPANTDYQAFKAALKAGTAQLEDANGTAMTADQITTFVSTLP